MSGFFSKLFGGKGKSNDACTAVSLVETILNDLLDHAGLNLHAEISASGVAPEEEIVVELTGDDEDFLTEKEGALLDSFQLFIKRAMQHRLPDSRANVSFDCRGFREESNRELIELAERLKDRALDQGRPVYLRALPPKDRKVVHQHLASDDRVRSRSVGEGLFKKIKISPARSGEFNEQSDSNDSESKGRAHSNERGESDRGDFRAPVDSSPLG